jgi:hypothetical protein
MLHHVAKMPTREVWMIFLIALVSQLITVIKTGLETKRKNEFSNKY